MCGLMTVPGYGPLVQGSKARAKNIMSTVKRMKEVKYLIFLHFLSANFLLLYCAGPPA